MSVPVEDPELEHARRAVALRQKDPHEAAAMAEAVLGSESCSPRARVVALVAKALAVRELNDLAAAEELHDQAIAVGTEHGLVDEVARARSALVGFLCEVGDPLRALAEADLAASHLNAHEQAELDMRRANALRRMGRMSEAVDAYTAAVEVIDASADVVGRARVYCNRGVTLAFAGRHDEAVADFVLAEDLAAGTHQHLLAAGAAHNLGFVHGRRGDIVAALEAFDRARVFYETIGFPGRSRGVFEADRCAVLLSGGLFDEARAAARAGVDALEAVGDQVDLTEARLLLSRASLAAGDPQEAIGQASLALVEFERSGRLRWASVARLLVLRARAELGDTNGWNDEAAEVIAALADHGWTTEADELRIFGAEMALRAGDTRRARRLLRQAAAARRNGRADHRAQAWRAAALLRLSTGDRVGAFAAIRAGLRVIDDHRALLGATELRVGASSHAASLARMGQTMALEGSRPAAVLFWADRLRAAALDMPTTRPPDDDIMADELAALRVATDDLVAVRLDGGDDREQLRLVRSLETTIRDRARRVSVAGTSTDVAVTVRDVRRELPHGCFVEYLEDGGRLHAVAVSGRTVRHDLGRVDDLAEGIDDLHFSLRRLASGHGSPAARRAAADAMIDSLAQLGRVLIDPVVTATGPVVIVPTGALHTVPWAALASLRGRSVTVSPSGSLWLGGRRSTAGGAGLALVAGPDLPGGRTEVRRLRRVNIASTVLTGRNATVAATLAALATAHTAHIAAHGHFRADSPMFSSLRLHDGPLTVYDLEGLRAVPDTVVLPACDAGVADVRAGDELIGTTSALLGLGVATVIAPIAPVSDSHTTAVMLRLHRLLAAGVEPAVALAEAVAPCWESDDPADAAVAAAFTCFGVNRGVEVSPGT